MASPGREIMGVMLVEQHLGRLRERHMGQIIAGSPPTAAAVEHDETEAISSAWARLDQPEPVALFGKGPPGPSDDGSRLAQAGVLAAHRSLALIPVVGDPRLAEGPL